MKRLHTRFLVYILLPVIGVTVLTGLLSLLTAQRMLEKQLIATFESALKQSSDELETTAWRGLQTLMVMSVLEESRTVSHGELRDLLTEVFAGLPVRSFFVGYADGRYVSSADPDKIPPDYDPRDRPWYRRAAAQSGPTLIPPHMSETLGIEIITVALRITDDSGAVIAVAGYDVSVAAARKRLLNLRFVRRYAGARAAVFTREGLIVFHTDAELVGRTIPSFRHQLYERMWRAVKAGDQQWHGMGLTDQGRYYGGYQKTILPEIFIALEAPLAVAAVPLHRLAIVQATLGLITLAVLFFVLIRLANRVVRPLQMLTQAAESVREGDYKQTLPAVGSDEVGNLVEAFNTMTEGLRQRDYIRNTFGRYLNTEVVDRLLESEDGVKLGGETRDLSILLSDLRGFTAQTAEMPSERVLSMLNRYLGRMVEIILDHGGTVDEIIGDGILAFFGAPEAMEDHPARAVACALEMQAEMTHINELNESDGLPRLEMGIAVNTGRVIVGNIGSERRTKYGVVGSEVNLAGRIESYTLGGQVLIGPATYDRIKAMATIRDVIPVEMKGVRGPVNLYDVRGLGPPYDIRLQDVLETPAPLEQRVPVCVNLLDGKVVIRAEEGRLTHLSERSAIVLTSRPLEPHSELRLDLLDEAGAVIGSVFGKTVEKRPTDEEAGALVRFTFVSPEIRRYLRHVPGAGG